MRRLPVFLGFAIGHFGDRSLDGVSQRRTRGSYLENLARFDIDPIANKAVQGAAAHKMHSLAQQPAQPVLQADVTDEADLGRWVEFDQQIDVAFRAGFAASRRTEYGE